MGDLDSNQFRPELNTSYNEVERMKSELLAPSYNIIRYNDGSVESDEIKKKDVARRR